MRMKDAKGNLWKKKHRKRIRKRTNEWMEELYKEPTISTILKGRECCGYAWKAWIKI